MEFALSSLLIVHSFLALSASGHIHCHHGRDMCTGRDSRSSPDHVMLQTKARGQLAVEDETNSDSKLELSWWGASRATESQACAFDGNAMAGEYGCGARVQYLKSTKYLSEAAAKVKVIGEYAACCSSGGTKAPQTTPESTTSPTMTPSPAPQTSSWWSKKLLKVMSYNTQYNNYQRRVHGYGSKIAEVGAASVGTQECQDSSALASASGYTAVPGTGFQNPILYKSDVVSFVDGSSGWMNIPRDGYAPRTITWARFKLGQTYYWHFNTHLPHNQGEAMSRNTHAGIAKTLLRKRKELGAGSSPTVVTGDMNTFASDGASEGSFESNLVAGGFKKSYQARGNPGHAGLDQIFHSTAHFTCSHGADEGTGGSDHPAIIADLAY